MPHELYYFYHEDYLKYDFGRHHPMNKLRIQMTYDLLTDLGFFDKSNVHLTTPTVCSDEDLLTVHSKEYVEKIRELSKAGKGFVDKKDTPAFKGMFEVTKRAVGGTIDAVDLIMNNKTDHAWNPLGGFHHAKADKGAGFCVFNDIAIAIKRLITKYGLERILYVDIDAHHSDGVQEIFYDDERVFKISLHESGETLFPYSGFSDETGAGSGEGYNINIPLPIGTFDEAYTHIAYKILPLVAEYFDPQFIIFVMGTDAHYLDPLSHLSLTSVTYAKIANLIHDLSHRFSKGRILLLGGGGYSLNATPRMWALMLTEFTETQLNNEIPDTWVKKYKDVFNSFGIEESVPLTLKDSKQPKIDPMRFQKISRYIRELSEQIVENIYLLYGFFKIIK